MYGETGAMMRAALTELLRQHRIQERIGGVGRHTNGNQLSPAVRETMGLQIRQHRHTILTWSAHAVLAAKPLVFSASTPGSADPFVVSRRDTTAVAELAHALHQALRASSAGLASLESLTTPQSNPIVECWRQAARAAALAEHDTNGPDAARLTSAQAQALVGDVAAITQALVVLDRRYDNTPGWEGLSQARRLGWTALAAAVDVTLGQPDYSVDGTGWRPRTKILKGPAKPGILGVLQAEHNLLIRLQPFPNMINLRLIVDSQRQLSSRLVPFASRVDDRFAERWTTRASTYHRIQQQLRDIGGRLGTGGLAASEAANAVTRLRAIPADTVVAPNVLTGFQTLFDRLDGRVADIVEDGIDRSAYVQRVMVPRVGPGGVPLAGPKRETFKPVTRSTDLTVVRTLRDQLRPDPSNEPARSPGRSRAELHGALLHRPSSTAGQIAPQL